ncbi:MAG: threonine-phosphate decarboxylase CobD [Nitrospirota bacterium]
MALPHGGNIYHYSKKYGIPEDSIADFSASINPLGPPEKALVALDEAKSSLINYPDPDCKELIGILSERLGIGTGSILIGNGSTEFIYLLPRALKLKKAVVLSPTFSDYERAALLAGYKTTRLTLSEKQGFQPDTERLMKELKGGGLFFLCNPNNPTGVLMERERLLDVLHYSAKIGAVVCVDEAFIEYAPGQSIIKEAVKLKNVAVLRNFTKFYGMPGIRIGYLAASPGLVRKIKAFKEPWSVNGLALKAAAAAIADEEYTRKSLELAEREKKHLLSGLSGIPCLRPFPSAANFILVKLGKGLSSNAVTERLAARGILVRDCSSFRGLGGTFIRVAVKSRRENRMLLEALQAFTSSFGCDRF